MNIYLTLTVLWLGHFLVDFMISVFPVYKTMVQMDLATAGMVASFGALIGEATQLLFGALSDRGYRRVLLGTGVFLTCCGVGVAYCGVSPWVFPLVLLTYVGSGAFHPAAAGLAGSLSPARKGLFISLFASGGSFGMAFGQLGFFEAYQRLGEWVGLLIIPSLIVVTIIAFYPIGEVKSPQSRGISLSAMMALFRQPTLRMLYIALVCNTTVFFGFSFLLPDLLVSRGYPSWICFGGGNLAMILGAGVMMVPGGYLADKFTPRAVMLASILAGLFLFYIVLLAPPLSMMGLLGMLFCLGALLGGVHPIGVALANSLLPQSPGLVSAFAMGMVWCLAECFGPATCLLTKLFPPEDAAGSALLVLATANFFGAAAAWSLPKHVMATSLEETG